MTSRYDLSRQRATLARWRLDHDLPTRNPEAPELASSNALHVTFAASFGAAVVDGATNKLIGRAPVSPGAEIILGGKGRRVESINPLTGAAIVRTTEGGTAQFGVSGESVFEELANRYLQFTGSNYR